MIRNVMIGCIALSIGGCATPTTQPLEQSSMVEMRIDSQFNPTQCEYISEITGSEGHWYSYLFYTTMR